MPLLGTTNPSPSGPWSDGNEGVARVPQSSSITKTPPSDFFMFIRDTHWVGAEKQSVYSTAPADWATLAKEMSFVPQFLPLIGA